jgi:hypothetical protein
MRGAMKRDADHMHLVGTSDVFGICTVCVLKYSKTPNRISTIEYLRAHPPFYTFLDSVRHFFDSVQYREDCVCV